MVLWNDYDLVKENPRRAFLIRELPQIRYNDSLILGKYFAARGQQTPPVTIHQCMSYSQSQSFSTFLFGSAFSRGIRQWNGPHSQRSNYYVLKNQSLSVSPLFIIDNYDFSPRFVFKHISIEGANLLRRSPKQPKQRHNKERQRQDTTGAIATKWCLILAFFERLDFEESSLNNKVKQQKYQSQSLPNLHLKLGETIDIQIWGTSKKLKLLYFSIGCAPLPYNQVTHLASSLNNEFQHLVPIYSSTYSSTSPLNGTRPPLDGILTQIDDDD